MRILALIFAVALLPLAGPVGPARATPAEEAPWLPEAAAYRLTLFLGNLAPVPWDDIRRAWAEPYRGSDFAAGAWDRLGRVSALDTGPLRAAIAAEDRQATFAAATRLIAGRILEETDRALAANDPATAQRSLSGARELYRAFADHLAAADAQAARTLGRAWLELGSSLGSAGVLGAGATAPDAAAAGAARTVITDYMAENYLVPAFALRRTLSAIPETVAASGRAVALPLALPPGSDILDQVPLPRLVLRFEEEGIEETDLPLVAYGDMLFDSPQIFGSPARDVGISCATCHNRSDVNNRLFIPGLSHVAGGMDVDSVFFNPIANDRRDDPVDTPSLRGIRFTAPYGRDGRVAGLREFTRNVIVGEFAGAEPTPFMLDALMAYMLEFEFLPNSMLAADGSLTEAAPEAARRGEAIFNRPFAGLGGQSCATCHQPSANFIDREAHDIGSAPPGYAGARSGSFDTPTLLGAAFTAPYFHDGSLPTLASVVDWFDTTKALGLGTEERADLTAYLEAIGGADDPFEEFDDRNTPFRLAFEELTTFASTLDTLLPLRDAQHILLLTDTVAGELAVDASTMLNLTARPAVYALAERLDEVGAAVRAGDWAAAEAGWDAFRADAEAIDAEAF